MVVAHGADGCLEVRAGDAGFRVRRQQRRSRAPVAVALLLVHSGVVVIGVVRPGHRGYLRRRGVVRAGGVLLGLHQSLVVVSGRLVHHAGHVVAEEVARVVLRLHRLALSPEAARPPPEGALLEHELAGGVDGPVVALPRSAQPFGELDEALVEREVVPDRVLPTLVRPPEERESLLEERVDLAEGEALGGRVLDGHDYEGDVRVRRLLLAPDAGFLVGAGGLGVQVRGRALRGDMLLGRRLLGRLVRQDDAGVVLVEVEVVQVLLDVDALVQDRSQLVGPAHFRQLLLLHHTLNIYSVN